MQDENVRGKDAGGQLGWPSLVLFWLLLCAVWSWPALAQTPEPNRIRIDYATPTDPQHLSLYNLLKEKAVLERIQTLLSPFRLPRPLTFRTAGCDGEINAWFDKDAVTICYEYVDYVLEAATSRKRPDWVTETHAITGPMLDVFLHEGAHALFAYLDIPLLGREEDAADQVAAYILLSLGRQDTPQLIGGIVYLYLNEAGISRFPKIGSKRLRLVDYKHDADVHSTPIQRMFNTLCLAYGASPDLFADVVKRGALPSERAEGCAEEFAQVDKAFRRLIQPHLDPEVLRRVLARDTLSVGRN